MDICVGCVNQGQEVCVTCRSLEVIEPDASLKPIIEPALHVNGCLFPGEELFLGQLARDCTGKGVIVELGSYLGRSTISLALGSLHGSKVHVHTFDNYVGDSAMETSQEMAVKLQDNLQRAKVDAVVTSHIYTTQELPSEFENVDVELLFIDADHSHESALKDFSVWEPQVVVGGKIAFHDTYDLVQKGVRFIGPLRVIHEQCTNSRFKIVGRCKSITVVEKCGVAIDDIVKEFEQPIPELKPVITPKRKPKRGAKG